MANDAYMVLARKWRPQRFEDVVGQEHITRTIQNAISAGRIGHAFLFIGSRGIGKTTTARILASALNCESFDQPTPNPCGTCDNCRTIAGGNSIDVLEIDGASNNGVDDVRQIRENIRLIPSRSRYKIYIIDEVHQLSAGAFNALLKTLEEPPPHAVFILATTETHKLPATIISRCQRYDFRRAGMDSIMRLLRKILEAEGIACTDEALHAIARAADGGFRDSESILEQIISYCGKTIEFKDVFDVLGLVDWDVFHQLCRAMLDKDIAAQLRVVEDIVAQGKDLSQFVQDLLQYHRNLLVCKTADAKALLALPDSELDVMNEMAAKFSLTGLIRLVEQFAELSKDFDSQIAQRIALEALLIRLSKVSVEMSLDTVLEKLVLLGAGGILLSGEAVALPPPPAANETAASVRTAAKREAPRGRPFVTADNLGRFWRRATELVAEKNLNVGIALGHATPSGLEGDTLVLTFGSEYARAMALASRPENVELVNETFRGLAENVRSCRIEVSSNGAAANGNEHPNKLPIAGAVSVEDARAALSDPHVAKVIEVFRGRIVNVRHAGHAPEHA